jgi:hypothetical protein
MLGNPYGANLFGALGELAQRFQHLTRVPLGFDVLEHASDLGTNWIKNVVRRTPCCRSCVGPRHRIGRPHGDPVCQQWEIEGVLVAKRLVARHVVRADAEQIGARRELAARVAELLALDRAAGVSSFG